MQWSKLNILFVLLFLTSIVFLVVEVEGGKKKRKFEGDFEFADEEEETKLTSKIKKEGKKTWILDPGSDLCQALKCKNKKEFCLLEDEFTAVCVSKKELHKNGDIIIPKSKFKGNIGQKVSDLDEKNTKDYEDNDDDSDYYDEDDEDEDDVWSNENLDDFGKEKTTKSANSEPLNIFSNNIKSCNACPVTKPTFLCASDNRTYSSLCRLEYHNCIQKSQITIACKGFCPCKGGENKSKSKSGFSDKQSTQDNEVPFIPTAAKDRYTKHKDYSNFLKKKTSSSDKQRSFNDVLETKFLQKDCTDEALESMGNRLLDWFSVVFSDTLKRKLNRKTRNNRIRFPRDCKKEVQWMFNHLNRDEDELLSIQELFDLENDRNEKCIKPFIDRCDIDKDLVVNSQEWCRCFAKSDRPCSVIKRKSNKGLLGGYVPQCDDDGYYQNLQCHGSTGLCWCVDKHGVEFPNTRTRGKPSCGSMKEKEENDLDDDEDSDFEGSGLEI